MSDNDTPVTNPNNIPTLVQQVTDKFAALPQVQAIALAGSRPNKVDDSLSDFDIYIYSTETVPVSIRTELARQFAERMEIDNPFFEQGDEWIDKASHTGVDLIYRSPQWIEDQLDRVLVRQEASIGYSTCFWFNVLNSQVLFDRTGWYSRLQAKARQPYPAALAQAIVAKNYPLLRDNISSYTHQIEKALERNDLISVNHRLAALLASYFDIIFAINHQPHPGEKRLLTQVRKLCPTAPPALDADIEALLLLPPTSENSPKLISLIHKLLDGLDGIMK